MSPAGTFGDSLCRFIETVAGLGEPELHAIELHVRAVHAVIAGEINARDTRQARDMVAGLKSVNAKVLI